VGRGLQKSSRVEDLGNVADSNSVVIFYGARKLSCFRSLSHSVAQIDCVHLTSADFGWQPKISQTELVKLVHWIFIY